MLKSTKFPQKYHEIEKKEPKNIEFHGPLTSKISPKSQIIPKNGDYLSEIYPNRGYFFDENHQKTGMHREK